MTRLAGAGMCFMGAADTREEELGEERKEQQERRVMERRANVVAHWGALDGLPILLWRC